MSPRHILVPAVVRIMPGLNQVGKPKSRHNATLHPSSLTPYPRRPQPLSSPPSVSPTPVSLSHAATASTLSPRSRPHASPSLSSTITIKSYWAINHYSAGRNHAVSNPLVLAHSSPCCSLPSHIHHVLVLVPIHSHLHRRPDASPNRLPDFHR